MERRAFVTTLLPGIAALTAGAWRLMAGESTRPESKPEQPKSPFQWPPQLACFELENVQLEIPCVTFYSSGALLCRPDMHRLRKVQISMVTAMVAEGNVACGGLPVLSLVGLLEPIEFGEPLYGRETYFDRRFDHRQSDGLLSPGTVYLHEDGKRRWRVEGVRQLVWCLGADEPVPSVSLTGTTCLDARTEPYAGDAFRGGLANPEVVQDVHDMLKEHNRVQ